MVALHEGMEALSSLIKKLEQSENTFNEAQTRFHIIDEVLYGCLGWSKDDLEVEKHEDRKFTDYELGKPRLAILEAKREGITFKLPALDKKSIIYDIPSLIAMSDEAKIAIEQVQDYCSSRGVAVAIVSNGHQYIAFLASRLDGVSPLTGKAVVFTSLEDMLSNFRDAWQLLSSAGLKERNISRFLSGEGAGMPAKLSSKLVRYPVARYSSELHKTLRQLAEFFLQDVMDSKELEQRFFEQCYCESGSLSQYSLLSKNILEARYSSLFESDEVAPHISPVKEKKSTNFSPDILAEAIAKRPIVLLGDVGVGKTSFVKNLMYNSAYEEFENALYIYVDLGSKAALTEDLRVFTLDEIERQLLDKYEIDVNSFSFIRGIYRKEINRFSNSLWGRKKESDPEVYETKLIEHLEELVKQKDRHLNRCLSGYSKSTRKQIIIAIDNADQRNFEIQQEAFIISQEIAQQWSAAVFISVRPQTFFKSKRSGALSAYPHRVFTISPPRIDTVITKRLYFALGMAEGNIPIEDIDYLRVNAGNLAQFLRALLSSLRQSKQLYEFLDNMTGGNIRSAIEFVTNFVGSPNVDVDKIIRIMNSEGRYSIPLHEFTKSALLGDYSHYNPDTSLAMNVYDVLKPDSSEHFLCPIILSFLLNKKDNLDNDGFCRTDLIFEEMQSMGFAEEQLSDALRRCTNKKLIVTSQRVTFEEDEKGVLFGDMPDAFRINTIGAYHLNRWLTDFTYFDAMVFDTPILEEEYRERLQDKLESLSISDRFSRAKIFRDYLVDSWAGVANKPSYFEFGMLVNDGDDSFRKVERFLHRD